MSTVLVYKTQGAGKVPPIATPPSLTCHRRFFRPLAIHLFLLFFLRCFCLPVTIYRLEHLFAVSVWRLLYRYERLLAMRKEIRVPEASAGRRCWLHKSSKKFRATCFYVLLSDPELLPSSWCFQSPVLLLAWSVIGYLFFVMS